MPVKFAMKTMHIEDKLERTEGGGRWQWGTTLTPRLMHKRFLRRVGSESWERYWLDMAARRRDIPEFEFAEIIEVDSLTSRIESTRQGWSPDLRQEFSPRKRSIDRKSVV